MSWLRTCTLGSARLRFSFQFCHNLCDPRQYDHSALALDTSGLPLLEVAGSHGSSHSNLLHSVMFQCKQLEDTQTFLANGTEAVTQPIPIKVDDVPRCTYKIFHWCFTQGKLSHCESGSANLLMDPGTVFHECGGPRNKCQATGCAEPAPASCSYSSGKGGAVLLAYKSLHATRFTNENLFVICLTLINRSPAEDIDNDICSPCL